MHFSKKKLPFTAALQMRRCPISSLAAYTPVLAPTYVFMKRNEKFVAVKGPLDFFTPEELGRYSRSMNDFFVPAFVDTILPIRDAARSIVTVLNWKPRPANMGGVHFRPESVCVAPYELTDAVLRILARVWGPDLKIEPYFASVFASELCGALPPLAMSAAREQGTEDYEVCLYRAGISVLTALQLGICDQQYLRRIYCGVFSAFAERARPESALIRELAEFSEAMIQDSANEAVPIDKSLEVQSSLSAKLMGRTERLRSELLSPQSPRFSVMGSDGFQSE